MEIILAIVVASAVIFFGALISIGNERQRRAIDILRKQIVLWAMQDLKIKREHLARTVQIPDPLRWLNGITTTVCGYEMKLQYLESFEEPQSLICTSDDGSARVAFSPLSPADLHRISNRKHNRLAQFAGRNPLLSLPRDVKTHEISVLNGGILFDLEIPLAWKGFNGSKLGNSKQTLDVRIFMRV